MLLCHVCPHTHTPTGEEKKPQPMALGAAVQQGIIANETLAYFIGRTWLFFCRCVCVCVYECVLTLS